MLAIPRHFTSAQVAPEASIRWSLRTSTIKNVDGSAVHHAEGLEFPEAWSQLAVDIASSKYFRKDGVPQEGGGTGPERSLKQAVRRIVDSIALAGQHQGYLDAENAHIFADELAYVLYHQLGAFNSPVWFNVGLHEKYGILGESGAGELWAWDAKTKTCVPTKGWYERSQASACFILKQDDSLMGIYDNLKTEARLFRSGSGAGSNFSVIRSKYERLSGGGLSSGLLSFLEVFDRAAGSTKSGGVSRRAAKMVILDAEHPEVMDFIQWKSKEEAKARALIAGGYASDFNGEAYHTVSGQNSNNSLRVTDEFMRAVTEDKEWSTRFVTSGEVHKTYRARELWDALCKAAWECADPGLQFDTTINAWHTTPNTEKQRGSNPCQPAWAPVLTPEGIRELGSVAVGDVVWSGTRWTRVTKKWSTGTKPVYRYTTRAGTFVGTEDHRVFSHGERVTVGDATTVDLAVGPRYGNEAFQADPQAVLDGLMVGDGYVKQSGKNHYPLLCVGDKDRDYFDSEVAGLLGRDPFDKNTHRAETTLLRTDLPKLPQRVVPQRYYWGDSRTVRSFLRGLYSANGSVVSNRVTLKATSARLVEQVQHMLSSLGIRSYVTVNKAHDVVVPNGTYTCEESYDLNVSVDRKLFAEAIGFIQKYKTARLEEACAAPTCEARSPTTYEVVSREFLGEEEVFDWTVEAEEHSYWTGGLRVSNCSEFLYIDDTACNLFSINLLKFLREDGSFDMDGYRRVIRLAFLAQEILVDMSGYPTQRIAQRSHDHRPLGLGYANLGALLMCMGLAYDSDEGRDVAAALTAVLTGTAYEESAAFARSRGPFAAFAANREAMLAVMEKHAQACERIHPSAGELKEAAVRAWEAALTAGRLYGYRNAQATVLAPAGTIGLLMDCDTTGVEPDFALVKHKKLAGGGYFKIVNNAVPRALSRLGYTPSQAEAIVAHACGSGKLLPALQNALGGLGVGATTLAAIEAVIPVSYDPMAALRPVLAAQLGAQEAERILAALPESLLEEARVYGWGCGTLEGAPYLRAEHYAVFDCANRCGDGSRFIRPDAHVLMLAAVQPFLSGSCSKTVNVPNESTVEDISRLYTLAWELGVKCVAIYRDGSKASQPLNSAGAKQGAQQKEDAAPAPPTQDPWPRGKRRPLPPRRAGFTQEARVGGHKLYLRTGEYEDGSVGEIFIDMHKEGAAFRSVLNALAIATSLALQHGVPLATLVDTFTFTRFEPQGPVEGDAQIKIATSVVDYIFRVLGIAYLGQHELGHVPPADSAPASLRPAPAPPAAPASAAPEPHTDTLQQALAAMGVDTPLCSECGHITVRNGACSKCVSCGASQGCSLCGEMDPRGSLLAW